MGFFSKKKTPPTPAEPVKAIQELPQPADVKKISVGSVKSSVLIQPLITEKATAAGIYLFKVVPTASKSEIRKEFRAKYGKDPRKVNVLNVMGKTKMRGRIVGKRSNWKKAMIYLAKGETVDLFQ